MRAIVFLLPFLFFISCTEKKHIPRAVVELDEKIEKMQKKLNEIDNKLKLALDHGLQIELTHERELLYSRLEREKDRIRAMHPTWDKEREEKALAEGGKAEEGHGGGGH